MQNSGKEWHLFDQEKVLKELGSRLSGLTEQEVEERQERYGKNLLEAEAKISLVQLFWKQIKNPLILLLLAAVVLSFVARHFIDAAVILLIILLNVVLGMIQEFRAEKALEAIRNLSSPGARVRRDTTEENIQAQDLVPGDIIFLETGDMVPADARILSALELPVNESMLTGESEPVEKSADAVAAGTPVADRTCMLYSSTVVTAGRGTAVVTGTGMATELGLIAGEVQGTTREIIWAETAGILFTDLSLGGSAIAVLQ